MEIDFKSVAADMLEAIKNVVGDNISDIQDLVDDELEDFAKRTATLTKKVAAGTLSVEQAKSILKIRKNAVETVILSAAGIGILAAEEAINAAIGVLKEVIVGAIPGASTIL
jgi:hypothetical protein